MERHGQTEPEAGLGKGDEKRGRPAQYCQFKLTVGKIVCFRVHGKACENHLSRKHRNRTSWRGCSRPVLSSAKDQGGHWRVLSDWSTDRVDPGKPLAAQAAACSFPPLHLRWQTVAIGFQLHHCVGEIRHAGLIDRRLCRVRIVARYQPLFHALRVTPFHYRYVFLPLSQHSQQ